MPDKTVIAVNIADQTISFQVDDSDINDYLNEQMPNDKVQSGYNFLARTVTAEDKTTFKKLALNGTTPRGVVVMQIAQLVAGEFGGDLNISIKKPSSGSKTLKLTDTAS